eukprot:c16244_g1_i2.p1 GENE.c16244_g1_i2~~c16244_g1_i2.p1  ORF type:complete len:102 (-),score=12.76 c16244_g1_i2:93-398(-)
MGDHNKGMLRNQSHNTFATVNDLRSKPSPLKLVFPVRIQHNTTMLTNFNHNKTEGKRPGAICQSRPHDPKNFESIPRAYEAPTTQQPKLEPVTHGLMIPVL